MIKLIISQQHPLLTKILAILGTAFILLPLLAPFVFGLIRLFSVGTFQFDFLMPAELFPLILIGNLILLVISLRHHLYRKELILSVTLAILFLILSQVIAIVTGLASGQIDPVGWPWLLVIFFFFLFWLALISTLFFAFRLISKLSVH